MAKAGRPPLGSEARKGRLLVCLESRLRTDIEELAAESRRSLSDYCRYVLEQHVLAVKGVEDEDILEEEPTPEAKPKPEEDPEIPKCVACHKSFMDCEC